MPPRNPFRIAELDSGGNMPADSEIKDVGFLRNIKVNVFAGFVSDSG